ncbi:MAG TPA: RuBisCO large subunit C-terminal-like domain-containing protein [Mobilitalea sp.]|nr:RuBisCO large subunit C-terminal-like domain-containing protein [Mobilitalea sp.]
MDDKLYCLPENIRDKDYIVATYYIKLDKSVDIIAKAASLAVGQTIGTWLPIPGITDEIRERHMGKVIQIYDVPAIELSTQVQEEERQYLIQIAYPVINFTPDFPLMLTALLGNDASTSAQVKLLDIEFPKYFAEEFGGPNFGTDGIRSLTGIEKRPLLLNMIKPCTGLSPEAGAKIFYETALGGVDLIKDDELLGSPSYSKAADRVRAFKKAADAAYEITGKKVKYIVNVTDGATHIMDTVQSVIDAGAEAIMVNFAAVGYSTLNQIVKTVKIPVLAHLASAGMFYEGINSGMSSPLAVGKLTRLAGADTVMINTPYGGYPLQYQKYVQTAGALTLPMYGIKPSMPSIGGGVHPGMVERYIKEMGTDIILAAGGAIQGHPMGAAGGAKAMMQAIHAVMDGVPVAEAAQNNEELRVALKLWSNLA